jgi:hypothetical protein
LPKQDVARLADAVDLWPIGIQLPDVREGMQMVRGVDRGKLGGGQVSGMTGKRAPRIERPLSMG